MKQIAELLIRFKNFGVGERLSKEALADSINELCGSTVVRVQDISIRNQTAVVRTASLVKNQVALLKEKILKRAGEKTGAAFLVKDIR